MAIANCQIMSSLTANHERKLLKLNTMIEAQLDRFHLGSMADMNHEPFPPPRWQHVCT